MSDVKQDRKLQYLIKIKLPADVLFRIGDARETLAKRLNGKYPAIFHYDEDGPINAFPQARFVGGRSWVGLLLGMDHKDIVHQVGYEFLQAVTKQLGQNVAITIEEHKLGLKTQMDEPTIYFVREMVIRQRNKNKVSRGDDIHDLVSDRIVRGLCRFANVYGFDDLPVIGDNLQVDESQALIARASEILDFTLIEITKQIGLPVMTSAGPTNEYATLVDATFAVTAKLNGLWAIGNLMSRGYGRVGLRLEHLHVNRQLEETRPLEFVR